MEPRAAASVETGCVLTNPHLLVHPVLGILLALALPGLATRAQLPVARLTSVFPSGAQTGTTPILTVQGSDLDGPERLVFSDPRIFGIPSTNGPAQFQVVIPPDARPGVLDVRFVGRFGISNPRAFVVDSLPEMQAGPDHRSTNQAFELPLDTIVNGRATANARTWFRTRFVANQRCVYQVQSRSIDSRLEPVLTLQGAAGNELARSHRGFLEFQAAAEGFYLLALHDVTFRGGDDFTFRLVASTGPYLDAAMPGALDPGKAQPVTLYGRNLPGGKPSAFSGIDGRPLESREVTLEAPEPEAFGDTASPRPSAATSPGTWWRWATESHRSNPLFFAASLGSTSPMVDAGDSPLRTIQPPVELWSRFGSRQKPGGVTLEARKGEIWWIEVFSERLGFNTDPQVVVQRAIKHSDGTGGWVDVADFQDLDSNFGTPGYPTTSRDAAGRVEIPENGLYRVTVLDAFHALATQPRLPYRLVIHTPVPHFQLVMHPVAPPSADPNQRPAHAWTTFLRRGETIPIRVLAFRREGFDGEIELSATNLPVGVTATPTRLYAGQNTATVLLQASDDAPPWVGAISVDGRSGNGAEMLRRRASAASILWNVGDFNIEPVLSRPTRGLYAAVSAHESAPVVLAAGASSSIEAEEGAAVSIPLRIARQGEFKGELKLKTYGHPELEKLGELVVPANATNATLEIKLSERKLPVGRHSLYLQGLTQGKYRNQPEAVALATRELEAASEALKAASVEEKAKAEAAKGAAEARKKAAEEKAQPRDVTLLVTSAPIHLTVKPAHKP